MFRFFMAAFGMFSMFEIIIPLIFNKPLFYHLRPSTYRKRYAELKLEEAKKREADARLLREAAELNLSAITNETRANQLAEERARLIERQFDEQSELTANHSGAQSSQTGKIRSQE